MKAAVVALALALGLAFGLASAATPAHAGRNTSTEPICREPGTPIVDLYTFGIGPLVFEKFGHAMLCLTYEGKAPICFNYGITDFANPGKLVWGFMRSKAKFWVAGEDLRSMLAVYGSTRAEDFALLPSEIRTSGGCLMRPGPGGSCDLGGGYAEDRDIWRQRLPLTPEQARAVADKLCTDVEPEHRYYVYHHFLDNCTTRLRDLVDHIFDGKLKAGAEVPHPMTFREFGQSGLNEYTALLGLSDFVTGRRLDRHPTMWEAMFHPDVLRAEVERKLGIPAERIYVRKGPPFPRSGPTGRPWVIAISVLLTAPLALAKWRGRFERLARVVAVVPLVLMAVLIWTIFVMVSIDWIRWNEALFLFLPTDVVLLFLGPVRRQQYARVRLGMVVLGSLLCAVGIFRQPLWVPILTLFMPLALLAFDWPRRRGAPAADAPPATSPAA